jgi:hypothetical protein
MEDEKMSEEMNENVQKQELSTVSKVFKVFYEPSAVFRTLTKKIDWLVPLLIIAVIGGAIYYITMPITSRDMKETIAKNMEKYKEMMTEEQYNEIISKIDEQFADPYKWYSPLITTAAPLVIFFIISAISIVTGNFLFGGKSNFWIVMNVVGYAALIGLLGEVVNGALILAKDSMQSYTGLGSLTSDDSSFLFYLFRQIDVFTIWRIVATTIGLGVIYNMKPKKFAYVLFPVWLIFIALVAAANMFTGGSIVY